MKQNYENQAYENETGIYNRLFTADVPKRVDNTFTLGQQKQPVQTKIYNFKPDLKVFKGSRKTYKTFVEAEEYMPTLPRPDQEGQQPP